MTDLVELATDADETPPLSEHVMLHLRHGGDAAGRNLLLREDGALLGYAHLDLTDTVAGPSAELAVHPSGRGRGLGSRLAEEVLTDALAGNDADGASGAGRLRLWAHGGHPAAAALAQRHGLVRSRVLWQMRRSLFAPLPAPTLPEAVTVRTFRPGADEQAWTELNARAFADHPEQGRWGVGEVRLREQEPWFDPAGFFLAERADALVGFHWTKVHGGRTAADGHDHDPIGEVYVVGVDPDERGHGLGAAMTLVGLRHLRRRGLPQAMLYVDESNTAAIRVYERLGFTRWDTDVCWSLPE